MTDLQVGPAERRGNGVTSGVGEPTLAGYQLRLPSFEGPLDVLLGLIERERLEISELSLVAVTDGFLAYLAGIDQAPPALLAEFAGVATRLLVLKSRAMLPRPPIVEDEPDVDDLARQLREYQQAKRAAESFRALERGGLRTFARPPATDLPPPKVILEPPPVGDLRRALLRTLARARVEPEVVAMLPVVSIGEMIERLRSSLRRAAGRRPFRAMLGTRPVAREETIAGFIALLALWRRGEAAVEQEGLFAEIYVSPPNGDGQ